jgi:hypothetical protein
VFATRDAAGNWNRTEVAERELRNIPPTLVDLDVWEVTEGERAGLNLLLFIQDPNDYLEDHVIGCEHPNVTLDGFLLQVRHDVWVPDYVVEVSIADVVDTTWHNITIHIIEVNDPPVIVQLRFNGNVFDPASRIVTLREGKGNVIAAIADDEEGDPLTFTWMSGDHEVANGSEITYRDLPQGNLVLTLVVDDGTDSDRIEVPVVVVAGEEPGSLVWVWVVLAFVVISITVIFLFVVRGAGRGPTPLGASGLR